MKIQLTIEVEGKRLSEVVYPQTSAELREAVMDFAHDAIQVARKAAEGKEKGK